MCAQLQKHRKDQMPWKLPQGEDRTSWRDQRCLSGQVTFGLDLGSKRRFLHVENRKRAFPDEKGVPLAQELRLYSGSVLENHNNHSAGSQVTVGIHLVTCDAASSANTLTTMLGSSSGTLGN